MPKLAAPFFGLTRDSGPSVITRVALESVCYQTMDLLNAMRKDGATINTVRVDGGMVKNDWLTQYLANVLDIAIERPRQTETTALGAAYLAGLQCSVYHSLDDLTANWQQEHEFHPAMDSDLRKRVTAGWADAVRRTRSDF